MLPQTIQAEEFTVILPLGVPLTLVKVPAGTFQMGSPESERGNILGNETQHQVTLTRDYYLGKTEITGRQWWAVMGTRPTNCHSGSNGINDNPVSCVSWDQITGPGGFVEKLNQHLETTGFRLPTEAEWERAARAGTTTRFAHGDVLECSDECEYCEGHWVHMWYCGIKVLYCIERDTSTGECIQSMAFPTIRGVGLTVPNPFGLYDMHGNVWEWVQDRYQDYSPEDVTAILGEPGHRWLTAQGPYKGDTANLTLFVTKGSVFDSVQPPAVTDSAGDGTMTLEFSDCANGLVSYEIASLGTSGEIPIQRIALDNVALCEMLSGQ